MIIKTSALLFLVSLMIPFSSFAAPLDLATLRQVGESQIKKIVGNNFEIEGIFFRDGAAAYDTSTPADLAAVFVVAKVKDLDLGIYRIAYVANFTSTSTILLVTVQDAGGGKYNTVFFQPLKGIGTFPTSMNATEMQAVLDSLKPSFSDVDFNLMKFIGSLSFEAKSISQGIELLAALSKHGLTGSFSRLMYASPLAIDPSVFLGMGLKHEVVDTEKLRSITAQLKEKGATFTTDSGLPAELRQPGGSCKDIFTK